MSSPNTQLPGPYRIRPASSLLPLPCLIIYRCTLLVLFALLAFAITITAQPQYSIILFSQTVCESTASASPRNVLISHVADCMVAV